MLDNFKLPNLLKKFGDGPAWPVHKAMSIKTWMSELGVEPLYEWSKWVEAVLAAKGGPTSHWTLWLRMGFQLKHICVSRYTSKYFCHYGDMVVTRCTEPEISHQQQQQSDKTFYMQMRLNQVLPLEHAFVMLSINESRPKSSNKDFIWFIVSGFVWQIISFTPYLHEQFLILH